MGYGHTTKEWYARKGGCCIALSGIIRFKAWEQNPEGQNTSSRKPEQRDMKAEVVNVAGTRLNHIKQNINAPKEIWR